MGRGERGGASDLQRRLHPARPARRLAGAGSFRGALWGVLIRAAALVAVLLVAGCGGAGAGGEGDPASVVPADAQFYAEAVVRPEGELRDDALDAAGKVLVTDDPGAPDPRAPAAGDRRLGR